MVEYNTRFFSTCKPKKLSKHKKQIQAIEFNSSGDKLASGGKDCAVHIWTVDGSQGTVWERELKGHKGEASCVKWNPASRYSLCTAGGDKTVRFWDVRTSKQQSKYTTKSGCINMAYSPDGRHVAVSDRMDMLYIYDTRTRKCLSRTLFDEQINEYVWDGSGEHLLLTTGSGNIDISKYTAMTEPVHRIPSHLEVIGITFDRHYNYLATTATDGMIQIYDAQELASVNQITRSESMVRDMGFSHDGQFIAFASEEKKVDVCDVLTGDLVFSYPLGREIYSVAWHPHKMVLAFGGETEATVTQQPQRQYNSYHNRNYHSRQNHTVTTIAAPITLVGEFKQ